MFYIVPSSSPTDFSITVDNSTGVLLEWNPPPLSEQNGIITGYNVSLINTVTGEQMSFFTTSTQITVGMLKPFTIYRCAVAAYTLVGMGPFTTYLYFETDEAG